MPGDLIPPLDVADSDFSIKTATQCFASFEAVQVPDCIFGDSLGSRTVVVLGDSHAFMWLPGFDQMGKRMHWKVILLAKSACFPMDLPLWNLTNKAPYTQCDTWHDYSIARINRTKPDMVVLINASGLKDAQGIDVKPAEWEAAMERMLQRITIPNSRKVLFGNLPQPRVNGNPKGQIVGPDCLAAHLSDAQTCSAPTDVTVKATYQALEREAATQAGVHYVDITPWFCSTHVCTALIGKMNVYVHSAHLSATYAAYLSGALQGELQPIMDAP